MILKCKRYILILFGLIVISYAYLYLRWFHLWEKEKAHVIYKIKNNDDDTLRIAMIGDSWVEKLHASIGDTIISHMIESLVRTPVLFKSCGKGGEKSRGIYRLMFQYEKPGSKELLASGPDYCIVVAGINDAASNLGIKQYLHHFRLILDFLLYNHIRPVLVEIPDVDIQHLYSGKPIIDVVSDFLRSTMTGSPMYHFAEYREALSEMLIEEGLSDSVAIVPMSCWNGSQLVIDKNLFEEDLIHLNNRGYDKLSLCIAEVIVADLKKRTNPVFFDKPMSEDAHNSTKYNE